MNRTSGPPRRISAAFMAVSLAAFTTVTGCSRPDDAHEATEEADISAARTARTSEYDLRAALNEVIREVENDFEDYEIRAGVAVADSTGATQAGLRGEEPTWSTVKVPIAIAALRDGASPYLVDLAIKESDNDAAYALWSHVRWNEGDAGKAVKKLLAEYDSSGELQEPFGYSTWLLKDQAVFGSHLPCMPEAGQVYEAMDQIVAWQDNGLDKLPNTRAKGGWGLSEVDNNYTHRQIGVRDTGNGGSLGLAIEVTMPGASAEKAIPALNVLAAGVDSVVTEALDEGALKPVEACEPKPTGSTSAVPGAVSSVAAGSSTPASTSTPLRTSATSATGGAASAARAVKTSSSTIPTRTTTR